MARPNAMIALKMPDGMIFGKVRKVSVSRILFEVERDLILGQQFEWRMELTGWNATVLGRLQIRRYQAREDRPNLAEARIVHINGEDARRFQDWLILEVRFASLTSFSLRATLCGHKGHRRRSSF